MKRIVFVVEDDPTQAWVMVRRWEKLNCAVHWFRSPEGAKEKFKEITPHLVVSDCSMPDPGQGQALARWLRSEGYTGCIILVSTEYPPDIAELREKGIINSFLFKDKVNTDSLSEIAAIVLSMD